MKKNIIDCEVDMMLGWANNPSLTIIIDGDDSDPFAGEDIKWTYHGNGMITREIGDIVEFKFVDRESHTGGFRGYDGSRFNFELTDGRVMTSTNVWSSRAECAGEAIGEPLKDISIRAINSPYNVAMSGYGLKKGAFERLMQDKGLEYEMDGNWTFQIVKKEVA